MTKHKLRSRKLQGSLKVYLKKLDHSLLGRIMMVILGWTTPHLQSCLSSSRHRFKKVLKHSSEILLHLDLSVCCTTKMLWEGVMNKRTTSWPFSTMTILHWQSTSSVGARWVITGLPFDRATSSPCRLNFFPVKTISMCCHVPASSEMDGTTEVWHRLSYKILKCSFALKDFDGATMQLEVRELKM